MGKINFETIGRGLLSDAESMVKAWCPGGKLIGKEYTCASIYGGAGTSFRVNVSTGKWADFATGEKGGDLVSLYAAINDLSQIDAAKELSDNVGTEMVDISSLEKIKEQIFSPPPEGTKPPDMGHLKHGLPSRVYEYKNTEGKLCYYIARYDFVDDNGDADKTFTPFSWDMTTGKWAKKAWTSPRPLFGSEFLSNGKVVVVVEGEKACLALRKIIGPDYVFVVVTWQGGSNAINKTDWSALKGKEVVVIPDADDAGKLAAASIIQTILPIASKVGVVNTEGMPSGWDVADEPAWTLDDFKAWAKPRIKPVQIPEKEKPGTKTENAEQEEKIVLPKSVIKVFQDCGVALTAKGAPITNADNIKRVLENYSSIKDKIWYDEFHTKVFTTISSKTPRPWRDVDTIDLMVLFQREFHFSRVSTTIISDAVMAHAHSNVKNEPKDWLDSLKWDGTSRIDSFFSACFGCEVTEYITSASKNFWLSMVARIYKPGCKVDTMVCLDGAQGTFKSTALNIIGGKWFAESHEQLGSKDFLQALQGKMLIEISELGGFTKTDNERIKATLSCQVDHYRASYGRYTNDYPRQCIFVGTTNEKEIITDHTGGRRFWPITVRKINLELIKESRDQLFAEAASKIKSGEAWWVMPIEETLRVQESRRAFDDWETDIAEWCYARPHVTSREIAMHCLKIPLDRIDKSIQMRIGRCLKAIGFSRKSQRIEGKNPSTIWVRKS